MGRLFPVLLLLAAGAAAGQPRSLEEATERYFKAGTYCETGRRGTRLSANEPFFHQQFTGCAHRDGRFRFVEGREGYHITTWTTDGETLHRHWESNGQYRKYPLAKASAQGIFGYRSGAGAPFLHSRLFTLGAIDDPSLAGYQPSAELSTAEYSVFERPDERWKGADRFWVRNADGALLKYERVHQGEVRRYVELSAQELGRPLSDADLSHRVALHERVSLQNNAPAFFALLFAGAVGAAFLFWWRVYARNRALEDVARLRRLLWRIQFWLYGVTGALLLALGVLGVVTPGSGHPPFIVFVMVLAIWWAVALALTASFTAISYVVQAFFRARAQ